MTHPVVAVVGATATGKSDLGVLLARQLGGEVVNADAMQLYRGMDIGTAKLDVGQRGGVAHHQIDVLEVTQEASVAAYQSAARQSMSGIRERGGVPVLVGGSGLYARAALDRLEIPPTDPVVRRRIELEADAVGSSALHARLGDVDPAAAANILPNNLRRVVRALEVIELTGRPFSATLPTRQLLTPTVVLGLTIDRDELDERIERRVNEMWAQGLLAEAQRLLGQGLRDGATASRAIGYRQAVAVVDGLLDQKSAIDETATATRKLARRQQSWFGADPRIVWLDAAAANLSALALAAVADAAQDDADPASAEMTQNGLP